MKEKLVLLGSTGSIGKSVLDSVRHYPDRFSLLAVSGLRNMDKLASILNEFQPRYAAIGAPDPDFEKNFPSIRFFYGDSGLRDLAALPDADTIVIAVSGIAGFLPTMAAIESGKGSKRILTANKEAIVAAGPLINNALERHNTRLIPLDSEHNAIFNIYVRMSREHIRSVVLTASGGPFREKPIRPDTPLSDVLSHPTWDMGAFITVNSATMINKGFEVIEAHYLFHLPYEQIRVLVHPQSIVHGMVETADGTMFMVASPSDMRYPISLALFYPEIPEQRFPMLDLTKVPCVFEEPNYDKFPLLKLSYEAGRRGDYYPCALNAANEVAVDACLTGKISFYRIPEIVEGALNAFEKKSAPAGTVSLPGVLEADRMAREITAGLIGA